MRQAASRLADPPAGWCARSIRLEGRIVQLVGRNCARCGEPIASELGGRFCPDCEAPVHHLCAGPPDGSGCPTCGALTSRADAPPPVGAVPPEPKPRPAHWPWRLRLVLAVIYIDAILTGLISFRSEELTATDRLLTIVMAIALGWWAVVDARVRRRPIPLLARPWFFLFAAFLVPAYVVWSRGWRGAMWVAVHVAGWFAVAGATMIVALAVHDVLKG